MSYSVHEHAPEAPEPRAPAAPKPAQRLPATPAAILALQRGAGNQAVARMLAREPAPPANAAAAAPETGVVPMLEAFWPDSTWSQGRLALDLLRPIPALGMVTGLTADIMGAWDDLSAIPTGDPLLATLNYGLIGFRSGLNIVVNGAQGLLAVNQTMQLANTVQTGIDLMSGIGAPKAVLDGAQTVRDFFAGSALSMFIEAMDGGLFMIDGLIMLEAGLWGNMGPIAEVERAKWRELAWGYMANAIGDFVTLPVVAAGFASLNFFPSGILAQAVDSATAVGRNVLRARTVILATLQSFWNVRGGNVLPRTPGLGPGPEEGLDPIDPQAGALARTPQDGVDPAWAEILAAVQNCYDRGESVLGEAAAGWPELMANAGAMGESAVGAPEALEALRAELPVAAAEMRARLASVEGLADQLDSGVETIDGLSDRLAEMLTAADGLKIPLDEVPEPARSMLEPVVAALEDGKASLLDPLRALQTSLAEVRPQLEMVAAAAHDTLALLNEGLDRIAEAAAHCDDIAEFVQDVASLPMSLASGDDVSLDAALMDWQTLAPQIQQAQAAL